MRAVKRYGWRPDHPDKRDLVYRSRRAAKLPAKVDLRPGCPPVYDQGSLGSCTANALAAAIEFDLGRQGARAFTPSRLFIYWCEREMEGTVGVDAGAEIRDGAKACADIGVCGEAAWPYSDRDPGPFSQKPPAGAFALALSHQVTEYRRVVGLADLRACLAEGFPVVFGFTVYESFEGDRVARTGVLGMPRKSERVVGGHAVLAVGYDDARKRLLVRNSWGTEWGIGGYFWMPYRYASDPSLSDDFWVLRAVEQ